MWEFYILTLFNSLFCSLWTNIKKGKNRKIFLQENNFFFWKIYQDLTMVKEIIMGIKRIKGKYILLKVTSKRNLERKNIKEKNFKWNYTHRTGTELEPNLKWNRIELILN